jgi:signal transduction histidine kinase
VAARRADSDRIALRVHDNGLGIDQSDLPHIFERFYRADKARTRSSGGTGLGLAITREIIARHHGTIEVESALGKGSTFTITLPSRIPESS